MARQQATLTATANSGFSFYEFNNGPYWLAGGLGSNPKTFYVPETGLTVNTGVEFTNTPVYTIDVTPNYFSSNLGVNVDGCDQLLACAEEFLFDVRLGLDSDTHRIPYNLSTPRVTIQREHPICFFHLDSGRNRQSSFHHVACDQPELHRNHHS